ncbi:hypothetical protein RB195_016823 [Necator americanus]|uniref:Uncharacterized protein n=2 Tax=Necator americanus TaxID=51031 RepID=W2TLU3_NECAM|nr:hypothetical protein NECAME_01880 [Necator americanus]ETN83080.1 hypothetical protein NECAME_01880 [Necator americanus]
MRRWVILLLLFFTLAEVADSYVFPLCSRMFVKPTQSRRRCFSACNALGCTTGRCMRQRGRPKCGCKGCKPP